MRQTPFLWLWKSQGATQLSARSVSAPKWCWRCAGSRLLQAAARLPLLLSQGFPDEVWQLPRGVRVPRPWRLLGQAEGRCSQQENVCLTLRVSARQESCCVQRLHPQMAAAEALPGLRVRLWLAKGCDGGLEASFQLKI